MKLLNVLVLGLTAALTATIACSSSSSSSNGTGGDINCSGTIGGEMVCYSYSDVPSQFTAADLCTAGTTSASSCPSSGSSGCCEKITEGTGADGYTYGYCYYNLPAADTSSLEAACTALKGTWST